MWVPANPNPRNAHVEDCVVRAIAIATGREWLDVYDGLCRFGRKEANMPSANAVWGKYLRRIGYEPFLLPDACPECTTVRLFCEMFPSGTYIIGTGSHAVAVIDGNYYDSWDSGGETPSYFWRVR